MYITFVDERNNRKFTYDDILEVLFFDDRIKVVCKDGFRAFVYYKEFDYIVMDKE